MIRVKKYNGVDTLSSSYHKIFEDAGRQNFFLSLPWFRNFERTILGPRESSIIYGLEDDTSPECVLAAFVLRGRHEGNRAFAPLTVESLANYYTSFFGPVIAQNCPDAVGVMTAFAEALRSDTRSWDICKLQPLDQSSTAFTALIKAFRCVGMLTQTYFCFGNWYLEVNGRSYDEYLKTLPTILKETIRRKTNRLQKHEGARIEIITNMDRVPEAITDYTKVYLSSWKKPEPFPEFMPGLIRTCAEMGWLRLGMVYVDNEPVATQLWIVHGGVASIYKLAYDERYADLSAGTVLTARLMRHVIDVDKINVVDYLTGDDPYKKNWMSHRRERWGIMVFNTKRLRGVFQATRHIAGRSMKRAAMRIAQPLRGAGTTVNRFPPGDGGRH